MSENEILFEELIRKIKGMNLLALPQTASRVLELSKDPANGPPEIAIPISSDPGLTAQVLKFVNSSFFGFRYKITTIQMALSLVCVRTVRNFILWNAVFALLPNPRSGPFQLKILCQDALRRGCFAKVLANCLPEIDSDELFVAALLQDMAIPVLAQIWPERYGRILGEHRGSGARVSALEKEEFGWDHAAVGAYLVKEWGFGDDMAEGIARHTYLEQTGKNAILPANESVIFLSSMIPSVLDTRWKEADTFFSTFHKFRHEGVPGPGDVFVSADEMFTDLSTVARIGSPSNSIVGFHRKYIESMSG